MDKQAELTVPSEDQIPKNSSRVRTEADFY